MFSANATPAAPFLAASLTVGAKFRSDTSGQITAVRFYKGSGNTGTHIGLLYSYPAGTLLGQATFSNETASGWQQVTFSTPVAITANTVYVVAYFSSTGFAYTASAFTNAGIDNAPLHFLQTGAAGPDGVYAYGSSAQYPSSDGGGANYWVDVVFQASNSTPVPDLTITSSHTGNFTQSQTGATYTLTVSNGGTAATSGTVTVSDTIPAGLTATGMSGTGWTCSGTSCNRSDALAANGSYPAITVTVTVAANAASSVTNTATVSGGGETNTANDTASDVTTILTSGLGTRRPCSVRTPRRRRHFWRGR